MFYKENIFIYTTLLIAFSSLFSWLIGWMQLAEISTMYIPMPPLDALFLIFSCFVLWMFIGSNNSKIIILLTNFLSILILSFSTIILIDLTLNLGWDIENFLIKNPVYFGNIPLGRMSSITAFLFINLSISLILLNALKQKYFKNLFGFFATINFFTSSVFIIAYIKNVPFKYTESIIPIALLSAVCIWILSIVQIIIIQYKFWPFHYLAGSSIQSKLTKVFIPAIIGLIALLDLLESHFIFDNYNNAVASTIFLILVLPIFIVIIVRVSKNIGDKLTKANDEIKESEKRFRNSIEYAPYPVIIHAEGEIIQLSNVVTELTGYTKNDIPTISQWAKMACGEKALNAQDNLEQVYEISSTQKNGEWEITSLDGKKYWWDFCSSPLGKLSDGRKAVITIATDITERKKTELVLQENEQKLRNIFENSTNVFYSHNTSREFNYFSPQIKNFLGYEPEEVVSKWVELISDNPINEISIKKTEQLFNNGEIQAPFELELIHKSGKKIWVEVREAPVFDGSKIKGVVGSLTDITERKKIETELILAKEKAEESNRLKSAFLANMSHEIRTPMNGILGFAELLKKPQLPTEKQQLYLTIIEKSGQRMLNTINDIVNISKLESGLMEIHTSETNINLLIENLNSLYEEEVNKKGIDLYFRNSLPNSEALIITDEEKLQTVLCSLIKNAIKFTKSGIINFGYNKKGNELEFFVKDTGCGINKEFHQIIFERFRQASDSLTRNYEGNGLGLSISKSYVEMLGGNIWVESEEGIGAKFYFTIPYTLKNPEINSEPNTLIKNHLINYIN